MKNIALSLLLLVFAAYRLWAQPPATNGVAGYFLTDSIELGRPFRYSLTFRHLPNLDILFPDTARHFAPYRVTNIAVFPTRTEGSGLNAISRDSAVYTLVSFAIDSTQLLRVPIRVIHETDCTSQWSGVDTVFLRSRLRGLRADSSQWQQATLATNTSPVAVRQQFNYPALALAVGAVGLIALVAYALFGRLVSRQWQLILGRRRFMRYLTLS